MKATTALSLLALPLAACNAATITLYGVAATTRTETWSLPTGSGTIEAIGTDANGATTYREHDVYSVYVEEVYNGGVIVTGTGTAAKTFTAPPSGATRVTYTSEPMTYEATIVAQGSHYVVHNSPKSIFPEASVSCDLDGKGGGACVQAAWLPGEPTVTTSWTGSAIPIATFVTDEGKNAASSSFRGSALGSLVSVMILSILFA